MSFEAGKGGRVWEADQRGDIAAGRLGEGALSQGVARPVEAGESRDTDAGRWVKIAWELVGVTCLIGIR